MSCFFFIFQFLVFSAVHFITLPFVPLQLGQKTPPPRAASIMRFSMGYDGDVLAARPTPLAEVRPQMVCGRHCDKRLVLDVTVPPLGGGLVEVPNVVSQVVEQNVDIPVLGGMVHALSPFLAPVVE